MENQRRRDGGKLSPGPRQTGTFLRENSKWKLSSRVGTRGLPHGRAGAAPPAGADAARFVRLSICPQPIMGATRPPASVGIACAAAAGTLSFALPVSAGCWSKRFFSLPLLARLRFRVDTDSAAPSSPELRPRPAEGEYGKQTELRVQINY